MSGQSYSENPRSYGSLSAARSLLAKNPEQREALLDRLIEIETILQATSNTNIREEVTGPIADLLFENGELLRREVEGGLRFNFRYSSKIARDFVLARGRPDHVWEPQTTRTVVALSRGRKNVLIGGAYIGDHALFAARALAPGGSVHCFELSADTLELLRANLKENDIQNVTVNREALWSEDGVKIRLTGLDSHASPTLADGVAEGEVFNSRSIDRYVADNGLDQLDLVMLDIEGGEFNAIRGAKELLDRGPDSAPAVICEIHRAYVDWSQGLRHTPLCALLIEHGYEVFAIRDYQGNEVVDPPDVELVSIDSVVLEGPSHGFNLLAVKSRARLSADIFRFVDGVSPKLLKHRDPKLHAPLSSAKHSL